LYSKRKKIDATVRKTIVVQDKKWEVAKKKAHKQDRTLTSILEDLLRRWSAGEITIQKYKELGSVNTKKTNIFINKHILADAMSALLQLKHDDLKINFDGLLHNIVLYFIK